MLIRSIQCTALLCLAAIPAVGQFPKVERLDPRLDSLLATDAEVDVLASGFTWTEGPCWVPGDDGGHLLFSDIPRNTIFKWSEKGGVERFMRPSGYTGVAFYGKEPGSNGLALDLDGRLCLCEHGDRRVSRLTERGGKITLADRYQGKRLNSPNDLVFHSSGDLFFTDPPYGLPERENDPRRELDHFGVYRLSEGGEPTLLTTRLQRPNGIGLSPDEKTLYVAQSDPAEAIWMAFPIENDGGLGEGKVIHDATERVGKEPGLPDGMAIDDQGNLWASGPGGIYIFTAEGDLLGRVLTGQRTSNCGFGGRDGNELFITADMHLMRVTTKVKGRQP